MLGVGLPVLRRSKAVRDGNVSRRVSCLSPPCKADKLDWLGNEIRLFDMITPRGCLAFPSMANGSASVLCFYYLLAHSFLVWGSVST